MIFYTDRFVPEGSAGCARGPLIFIRPACMHDMGLLEHERVHVRQWLRTVGLHSILYLVSKEYRLKTEVEAYRKQAQYYTDDRRPLFASYIANDYGLTVTEEEALRLLQA